MATGASALSSIGMSVEGAVGNFGRGLQDQLANETDEEKRKRLEAERQQRLMGGTGAAALSSILGGFTGAGSIGGMSLGKFGL